MQSARKATHFTKILRKPFSRGRTKSRNAWPVYCPLTMGFWSSISSSAAILSCSTCTSDASSTQPCTWGQGMLKHTSLHLMSLCPENTRDPAKKDSGHDTLSLAHPLRACDRRMSLCSDLNSAQNIIDNGWRGKQPLLPQDHLPLQ